MIAPDLTAMGVGFYDAQRSHGTPDHMARHAAVFYMRRKDADAGDAMPYYEALADALAARAVARIESVTPGGPRDVELELDAMDCAPLHWWRR